MARRLFLPVTDRLLGEPKAKPSAEDMRKRLGGRQKSSSERFTVDVGGASIVVSIGSFVQAGGSSGAPRIGVLLAVGDGIADVYFEKGMVKRTPIQQVTPLENSGSDEAPALFLHSQELATTRESLLIFDKLAEGDPVQVEEGVGSLAGILREKCKYGGLVEVEGARVLGVGFRKIWPAPPAIEN